MPQFSENSREFWARMGEQILCGSVYLYILTIRYCAPNIFLALPNLPNQREYWWIRMLKNSSLHYSSIYTRISENIIDEYWVFTYSRLFSENWRMCGYSFTSHIFSGLFMLITSVVRVKMLHISKIACR